MSKEKKGNKETIFYNIERNKEIFAVTLDISKAFDNAWRKDKRKRSKQKCNNYTKRIL